MSTPYFNRPFYLNSYESESSFETYDRTPHVKNTADCIFKVVNDIYLKRILFFFNKMNNNVYYFSEKESSHYSEEEDDFNIDNEEELRILKIQILKIKLQGMINIIKNHFVSDVNYFFEKLKLKVNMLRCFNKDDNYLYLLPKTKLFRFRNIYAYRRLLYVIKSFKWRNYLLINFFQKWKDIIVDYKCENFNRNLSGSVENIDNPNVNVSTLIDTLDKIWIHKTYIYTLYKLSFFNLKQEDNDNNTDYYPNPHKVVINKYNFFIILSKMIKKNIFEKIKIGMVDIDIDIYIYNNEENNDITNQIPELKNIKENINIDIGEYRDICKEAISEYTDVNNESEKCKICIY